MAECSIARLQKSGTPPLAGTGALLQRKCACGQHTGGGQCAGCKGKQGMLQRYPASASGAIAAPTIAHDTARSPGQRLNDSARDFSGSKVGSDFRQVRAHTERGGNSVAPPVPVREAATIDVLNRAASEAGQPIHEPLRSSLGERLGHDFAQVRVYSGPASAEAAERACARAYTLGADIHLGAEARGLTGREFDRLLTHEAVHTLQQGGRAVVPHAGLTVSDPADVAEQEAERMAESILADSAVPASTRALALGGPVRASMPGQVVPRSVSPHIQRDLKGKKSVRGGDFFLNLRTQSNPAMDNGVGGKIKLWNGMAGTVKFKASDTAPDSDSIRLLQTARTFDLTTGKDYEWTDGEADRNKIMTAGSKDVEPGFKVDVKLGGDPPQIPAKTPRTKKTDALVSPYYIEKNPGPDNRDGSKKGKTKTEASLWDYPGWSDNMRFSAETAAKAASGPNKGYVYASLTWGFTISDVKKGKVENEYADAHLIPTKTFDAAVSKFDEFYKNEGSSMAP